MQETLLQGLKIWGDLHPDFETHLWTSESIVSLARLYDHPLIVKAMGECHSRAARAELAMLFLLETVGGVWVDPAVRPLKPFLNQFINFDLVRLECHSLALRDRLILCARPGTRWLMKASDKVMIGIFRSDERLSVNEAIELSLDERCRVATIAAQEAWGHLIERRADPREQSRLPHLRLAGAIAS